MKRDFLFFSLNSTEVGCHIKICLEIFKEERKNSRIVLVDMRGTDLLKIIFECLGKMCGLIAENYKMEFV